MNKVIRINKTKQETVRKFMPVFKLIISLQLYMVSSLDYTLFRNRVCTSISLLENYYLTQRCDVVPNNNAFRIMENVTYWLEMFHNSTTAYAAFCTKFLRLPNCTLIQIDRSLISINETNVYVKDNDGYTVLKAGEYIPLSDGLAICIKISKKRIFKWYETLIKYENGLAVFCLFLSVVMEAILIATYTKLKELRTIHGKNLVSLSSSLFVCDVVMLFLLLSNNIPQKICQFTAAILPFFCNGPECMGWRYGI